MTSLATRPHASPAATLDAFLARPGLAQGTVRAYRLALERLLGELATRASTLDANAEALPPRALAGERWPTQADLEDAALALWGALAPSSFNRNLAAVRSFLGWARRHGYLEAPLEVSLERQRERADRTRAIPLPQLERLWRREDVALREKTLWRLLYETAARAGEILALNVEDLDLANHRARITSKGGDLELVHFQSGAARLLPRLLAGRRQGPVFLTDRAAPTGMPALDVCPVTGHARLSYRRAAALFTAASGGWTLHQLRHSAITHLAEAGESTVLLMAKSRHRSLRTLQRYARPGPEAVAALTARHDPARRRA